jgi:hypothetical protein
MEAQTIEASGNFGREADVGDGGCHTSREARNLGVDGRSRSHRRATWRVKPATTGAAVDRLVHHAVILEMNVQSYRQRSAAIRQKQRPSSDGKGDTKQKEIITASSP